MDTPGSAAGPAGRLALDTTSTATPVRQPALDLDHLTAGQRRGSRCAYCDRPVRSDHVIDLGQRRDPIDRTRVFPRAHPECTKATS